MINIMIIFSFICNVVFVGYLCYKYFPFYIEVSKTCWCKKIYSFTLMRYIHKTQFGYSAKGLFTIPIKNYNKITKWDNDMFNSGKYKEYRKHKK